MELGLIYARSRNGVIGKAGKLPWHLPEDLAHFKAKTLGCPVIMGRRTWESLPPKFRPLPGRSNIVVTRQPDWQEPGALRAGSLEEAVRLCGHVPIAWVTGGTQLFEQSLPTADVVELTQIDADFEGDTYAPVLGPEWREVARSDRVTADGLRYSFVTLRKA